MSAILQTIGRVRRAMPRNTDVMDVCDALERMIAEHAVRQEVLRAAIGAPVDKPAALTRAQIQRNYRKRKAKK